MNYMKYFSIIIFKFMNISESESDITWSSMVITHTQNLYSKFHHLGARTHSSEY